MRILSIILMLFLLACESSKPQNVDLSALYRPAEIAAWDVPGKGAISGQGSFRTQAGRLVTCAGFNVFLAPDIELSRRHFLAWRQHRHPFVAEGRLSQLHPYAFRTGQCDLKGNFAFTGLADGRWIVTTVVAWAAGRDRHEEMLMGVAEVEGPVEQTVLLSERGMPSERGFGAFIVTVNPWHERKFIIPAATMKHRLIVEKIKDLRRDKVIIGKRYAAFGVRMGDVYFYVPADEFLEDVIVTDLRGAGHSIVEKEPATKLNIVLDRFLFSTDTTPLYWDINGEIMVTLHLSDGPTIDTPRSETFRCSAVERTYIWPTEELFEAVVDRCVVQLMESVRRSEIWNFPSISTQSAAASG